MDGRTGVQQGAARWLCVVMISDHLQPADWPSAAVTAHSDTSRLGTKVSSTPSHTVLQSANMSHEAEQLSAANQHFSNSSHCLDNFSCRSLSSAHFQPYPSSSSYGDPVMTPPPTFLRSTLEWNHYYGDLYPSSCSSDQTLHGSQPWGWGSLTELRECVSCRTSNAPLWKRDATGGHLCYSCSLQQKPDNRPLLRAKRRTFVTQKTGSQCVNCSTQTTTLWRRNSAGQTVCNACGLYYKLHQVNRPLAMKTDRIQTRTRRGANKNERNRKSDQRPAVQSGPAHQ